MLYSYYDVGIKGKSILLCSDVQSLFYSKRFHPLTEGRFYLMDLIKEALSMGFANAAIMDTKDLVFVPEYRQFCEDNMCGNYNLVPACPPACGTVEEMHERAMKYEKALVLQTVLKDPLMDPVLFKQAKHAQNILTEQLAKRMQETGKDDVLIMSAGPYKNCSCMSAYSVDAQKMADAVGMICWADDSDVRFFTQILFHE